MSLNLNAGIPGRKDGTEPTTGYIGERINSGAISETSSSSSTFAAVTGASITLTAGNWLIFYDGNVEIAASAAFHVQLFTGSTFSGGATLSHNTGTGISRAKVGFVVPIQISTSTTYVLKIAANGSGIFLANNDRLVANDTSVRFNAIRYS